MSDAMRTESVPAKRLKQRLIMRIFRIAARAALGLIVFIAGVWAIMAINYSNLPQPWLRAALAMTFALGSIGVFVMVRPWHRALLVFAACFATVLIWYYLIPPSNDRNWQPDVVRAPTIEIDGNRITVHNVRHCTYRSETDYDVHYESRTYDRSKLQAADLIMSYWEPRAICHTFVSFVFDDGQYVCVSIETRKEVGEGYSAVRGLFRQFELINIIGDERDLIGVRTDVRNEDVYIYRLRLPRRRLLEIFDDYLAGTNELAAEPAWYNALTDSCSVGIIYHSWASQGHLPFRVRYLLNGYWDEFLYKAGMIDTSMPFAELRERSRVNGKVSPHEQEFSARIRIGLPRD